MQVAQLWRQKQIEYSFRLTLMETYQSFEWVTARSLDFALLAAGQEMSPQGRADILRKYDSPEPFADVVPGLQLLEGAGYSISVLSNGSPDMLRRCLLNSGLVEYVTAWVSVDAVGAFKPVPEVYRHAGTIFGRPMGELRLISCNPFDVVGAQVAGMSTAWVNRTGGPFDTIGDAPDMVVSSIIDLAHTLVRQTADDISSGR